MKNLNRIFGVLLIFSAMASVSHAIDPILTPEIDAGTAGSALTLVTGVLFILKDRLRGK